MREICTKLNEKNRDLIYRIVKKLGEKKSKDLLSETLLKEENGGVLTTDCKRRRSPGGVFLLLVKEFSSIFLYWALLM